MPKLLHLVVASAENRVIGRNGRLPWSIPEDQAHFRGLTAGNICIMGRICFDTWPDATCGGRQPIVLTSRTLNADRPAESSEAMRREARAQGRTIPLPARSLAEALAVAETIPGEIFICGGQKIFEDAIALRRPMQLHLTLVHAEVPGDRFFPEWRDVPWREVSRRDSGDGNYAYTFYTLERMT